MHKLHKKLSSPSFEDEPSKSDSSETEDTTTTTTETMSLLRMESEASAALPDHHEHEQGNTPSPIRRRRLVQLSSEEASGEILITPVLAMRHLHGALEDHASYCCCCSKASYNKYVGLIVLVGLGLVLLLQLQQGSEGGMMNTPRAIGANKEGHDDGCAAPTLLHESKHFLNDPTIRLSPHVGRPWLAHTTTTTTPLDKDKPFSSMPPSCQQQQAPNLKLVLTDFAWNHPETDTGLGFFRTIRNREFLQGFVDHPNFDPTFQWTPQMELATNSIIGNDFGMDRNNPSLQYIVLMDIETCFERNYPVYSSADTRAVSDSQHGRPYYGKRGWGEDDTNTNTNNGEPTDEPCFELLPECSSYIDQVLHSPLFQTVPSARLIYLDCRGDYQNLQLEEVRHNNSQPSPQLVWASISADPKQLLASSDMGLPPPAIHPVTLTSKEREAIRTCASETDNSRPLFVSFIGDARHGFAPAREALFQLNNARDIFLMSTRDFEKRRSGSFQSVMKESLFAATPRGDCKYSYRFTEALSAGAIPVVHSDGWVLPFRKELVDWSKDCAILIPEAMADQTVTILRTMTVEERCARRQRCYQIYQTYLSTPEGVINGIVDTLVVMHDKTMNTATEGSSSGGLSVSYSGSGK